MPEEKKEWKVSVESVLEAGDKFTNYVNAIDALAFQRATKGDFAKGFGLLVGVFSTTAVALVERVDSIAASLAELVEIGDAMGSQQTFGGQPVVPHDPSQISLLDKLTKTCGFPSGAKGQSAVCTLLPNHTGAHVFGVVDSAGIDREVDKGPMVRCTEMNNGTATALQCRRNKGHAGLCLFSPPSRTFPNG